MAAVKAAEVTAAVAVVTEVVAMAKVAAEMEAAPLAVAVGV